MSLVKAREIPPLRASPVSTAAKGKRKLSDVKREEIEISDDSSDDDEERRLLVRSVSVYFNIYIYLND